MSTFYQNPVKNIFRICIISFLLFSAAMPALAQEADWFVDISGDVGLDSVSCSKIQSVDINGDNYPDLLVGTGGLTKGNSNTFTLYMNVENPDKDSPNKRIYVDFTEESGINVNRNPDKDYREYDVAAMADLDNDGDLDLVTSFYYHRLEWFENGHGDRSEVYLNDGQGHFTLKPDAGLHDHQYHSFLEAGMIDAVSFSFLDYDYDGIIDLYIATKFVDYKFGFFFPDVLMKGNGDGSFTEIKNNGVNNIPEPLYGVNVTDWNNDGWQDVITSPYCKTGGRLLRNNKDGTFTDVQDQTGYTSQFYGGDWYRDPDIGDWVQKPLCQWEAPAADFDCDGDMDLLQCEVHGGYEEREGKPEGRTHIAVNQGPPDYKYKWEMDLIQRDAPAWAHLGDYGGLWTDFDNDGWIDLCICEGYYTPQSRRLYACIQRENHKFEDVSAELGLLELVDAAQAESCDFDLDGDNDIFVFSDGPGGKRTRLLRNDKGSQNNRISVKLDAPANCNRDALGARMHICSGTHKQIREIQAGMGHFCGQQPFIRNTGIGDRNRIDSIVVRWPMQGTPETVVRNLPLNVIVEIDENGLKDIIETWEGPAALIKFDRSLCSFDTVGIGEQKELGFKVVNIGDADLVVSGFSLEDNDSLVFELLDESASFTLAPQEESESYRVKFTPNTRADYSANIKFMSNALNAPERAIDLWGYGYAPKPILATSADTLLFPDGYADETDTQELFLYNSGEEALLVSSMTLESDDPGIFEIRDFDGSSFTIEAGSQQSFELAFTPEGKRDYTAKIIIESNSFKWPEKEIPILGNADGPIAVIDLDKANLLFGRVPMNSHKDLEFSVSNEGDANLIIDKLQILENTDEAYSLPDHAAPLTIAPGVEESIIVRFAPPAKDRYNTQIDLRCNAYEDSSKTIVLRGSGDDPESVRQNSSASGNLTIQIAPNPVSGSAIIHYELKGRNTSDLQINLYEISGRQAQNIKNAPTAPGSYDILFNAAGRSPGIYYIIADWMGESVYLPLMILGE